MLASKFAPAGRAIGRRWASLREICSTNSFQPTKFRSVNARALPTLHRSFAKSVSIRRFSTESSDDAENPLKAPREQMEYDVVIVGGGPAGLSAAIRLRQLCAQHNHDLKVCVVDKGSDIGAHILSGNVFDPRALNELIPDWKEKEAPLTTPVKNDEFLFLTESSSIPLPMPPMMHNEGNYIISLGNLCRWLATQAEELGVEIYPGFSASELLRDEQGGVRGIATADQGVGKDGQPKSSFARGMELVARQTLLAEGCRGSLSEEAISTFKLREAVDADPQTYALGLKEVWQVDPNKFQSGLVVHALGWPLPSDTYGGAFLYHMEPNHVLVGFAVGLDYPNPHMSPYEEFQRFKHHPAIRKHLEGGSIVSYGARCINEGGLQAIPKLTFPGGALIGCSAGFLNVPKIKGSHTAMKSGMLAAEAIFESLTSGKEQSSGAALEVPSYEQRLKQSWVHDELHAVRNVHPSFKYGRYLGSLYSGFTTLLSQGKEPWTFRNKEKITDAQRTRKASEAPVIKYPKPDGVLSFDLLTNLARSGTNHDHDQPSHLIIKDGMEDVPTKSFQEYAGPEQRFCPAKVYEFVMDADNQPKLQINAQNCLHCKCCSIKAPQEYIKWTVPPGGQGPKYGMM